MHSHPHGLTHPDKRGCVVYSRQLCSTAKNLGVLCCPAREVSHCRFWSIFLVHALALAFLLTPGLREFAHISRVIANVEPTFPFLFVCLGEVLRPFRLFSVCLEKVARSLKVWRPGYWKNSDYLVSVGGQACEFKMIL